MSIDTTLNDTKTAIIGISFIVVVTGVTSYLGSGIDANVITGAITAVAALATPGMSAKKKEDE